MQAGELRSCTAAVARVIVLLVALGRQPCSADTAAYCRARAKLPAAVIRRLALQVGNQLEARIPADWLWFGSYFLLALGLQRQVDWLARVHQARQVDVRRGQCIGRPDRVEPRALKRRPKPQRLLKKPRAEARAELLHPRPPHR